MTVSYNMSIDRADKPWIGDRRFIGSLSLSRADLETRDVASIADPMMPGTRGGKYSLASLVGVLLCALFIVVPGVGGRASRGKCQPHASISRGQPQAIGLTRHVPHLSLQTRRAQSVMMATNVQGMDCAEEAGAYATLASRAPRACPSESPLELVKTVAAHRSRAHYPRNGVYLCLTHWSWLPFWRREARSGQRCKWPPKIRAGLCRAAQAGLGQRDGSAPGRKR